MFFDIEGIDGAGCGTQRKEIESRLLQEHLPVVSLKFPFYENSFGEMIRKFLKEGLDVSLEMEFLLFAGQMVFEKDRIRKERKDKIIICDRYFPTTMVYQGIKGFNKQKALSFAKDFSIENPDLIFFLDTPVEVAKERKLREEGKSKLDIHESDWAFVKKVDRGYRDLINKKSYGNWEIIDNRKGIKSVTDAIVKIIKKYTI